MELEKSAYKAMQQKEGEHLLESRHFAPPRFFSAPFTHNNVGVHWPSRTIFYVGKIDWRDLPHEMGHAFATLDTPDQADELSFLGWEYALVQFIGADTSSWLEANKDYHLGDEPFEKKATSWKGSKLGDLPSRVRLALLKRLIQAGQKQGIIGETGQPLCVPRVFDAALFHERLTECAKGHFTRARMAESTSVKSGRELEDRIHAISFGEGYGLALKDMLSVLHQMTTEKLTR